MVIVRKKSTTFVALRQRKRKFSKVQCSVGILAMYDTGEPTMVSDSKTGNIQHPKTFGYDKRRNQEKD